MPKLPETPRQHTPTVDAHGEPTCCYVCGMRAFGLGVNQNRGTYGNKQPDPHYVCKRCAMAIDDYKKIRCLDQFELQALDGGVDAVGDYLEEIGVYDLTAMDDLNRRMIVKAAWEGCAARLRELLSDGSAPF
jgi:hypothetical protein